MNDYQMIMSLIYTRNLESKCKWLEQITLLTLLYINTSVITVLIIKNLFFVLHPMGGNVAKLLRRHVKLDDASCHLMDERDRKVRSCLE